ncbi:hypothetical protein IFT59_07745 [Rhizobium sp. CFBP 8752]|uniref:hypothetical protein n=1 Tax=Rhizobium sp. CFBP 8752 TaxID=2775301 RepID=UPI001785AE6B|nr:hypothetical protein [Rhizobium sp. CFBP 8752]MBD8663145.1 hypothetical protein [Rhizobium sp. CFBP 8752]
MAIKVIWFGKNDPNTTLNIIQRNGKKVALVTVMNIETISKNVAKIDSETAVSFAIEEVPLAAARKMLADVEPGEPAFIVLEYGKPVDDAVAQVVGEFVRRCVNSVQAA